MQDDETSARPLIERLRSRSEDAFEDLVKRYGQRLHSVSLRILRNPADAEEVVQETFLKAFKSLDRFRGDASLFTWLYRIVSNESISRLRRRGRKPEIPIEEHLPSFEDGQHVEVFVDWKPGPDDQLGSKELREFFERCVDELPESHRLAYLLKDIEGLPEERVAEILGITRSAMKNRVHRSRLAIRDRIEKRFFKMSDSS